MISAYEARLQMKNIVWEEEHHQLENHISKRIQECALIGLSSACVSFHPDFSAHAIEKVERSLRDNGYHFYRVANCFYIKWN